MTHAALASLCSYAHDNAGDQASELADFVLAYFDKADPDELLARGPATLLALANAHRRLLNEFLSATTAQVRVFNPTLSEHGFVCAKTVIQIVLHDQPFLVDSVTMAVNRSNRMAHWIVHPLLTVQCEADGSLVGVTQATADGHRDKSIVTLILVECDRIVQATERQQLADELALVLSDVRVAVADWSAMLQRLQSVRESSANSPLSEQGQLEGLEFLHWLEAEHFTFLGARDYQLVRHDDGVSLVAVPETGLGGI